MRTPEGFEPITAAHAPVIESFVRHVPAGRLCCEYALANLLAWEGSYPMMLRAAPGRLWFAEASGGHLLFPLGDGVRPQELRAVASEFQSAGACGPFLAVPAEWAEANRDGFAGWAEYTESADNFDYLYAADDLALLPGAKYSPKRNLIHQFLKAHPGHRVADATPGPDGAPEEVRAFLRRWEKGADRSAGDLEEEAAAMLHAYDHWAGGGFEGVEIRDGGGRLVALAIYSLPAPGLGVEHFEKADHEVKGASQMATWEAAKRMRARGAKWINREQDLGVPGLRRAKESFHPVKQLAFGALRVL